MGQCCKGFKWLLESLGILMEFRDFLKCHSMLLTREEEYRFC